MVPDGCCRPMLCQSCYCVQPECIFVLSMQNKRQLFLSKQVDVVWVGHKMEDHQICYRYAWSLWSWSMLLEQSFHQQKISGIWWILQKVVWHECHGCHKWADEVDHKLRRGNYQHFYAPVSHCVGCKIDTIVTVGSSLTSFDIIRVNKSCGSAAQ